MKFIHPTAEVDKNSSVGDNTYIWNHAQIREDAKIGNSCIIGTGVYIDKGSLIGDKVKIQNYASLFRFTVIEEGAFIGPYVCLTNDTLPRSIAPSGELQKEDDWKAGTTTIKKGASLGAGSIVLPGLQIDEYALIGAGSLVTKNIESHALAYGSPAKVHGFVCICGKIIKRGTKRPQDLLCQECQKND